MRKFIAAINMTLDGVYDHTAGIPDEEIHQHYTELLQQGDAILYGRKTYQLMEFWRQFLQNPSSEQSMNDFALAMERIPKIVFSRSLNKVDWETARISDRGLADTVVALKEQPGNDILVGSRSLIIQLMKQQLLDELQLCIYPVVAGNGLKLFDDLYDRISLTLSHTKTFNGGAVIMYYRM